MLNHITAKAPRTLLPFREHYRHIKLYPQLPNFAAHIEGVDLTRPLADAVKAELRQALLDYEVIFFPPQPLTPEQHLELAAIFGQPAQGAYFPRKDSHPKIEVLANDAERPPTVDNWHSDLTWLEVPPVGTAIQIVEVPEAGGNTAWSSMTKAFAALSPDLQHYLRQLTATHTWEVSSWREYLDRLGEEVLLNAIRKFKPVTHPVVLQHPVSGKDILYVNETFTKQINRVPVLESRGLLRFLTEWIKQPEFIYSHKWEAGGIAVWDNLSTQHYALADYWPQVRLNHRVTFDAHEQVAKVDNTLAAVSPA